MTRAFQTDGEIGVVKMDVLRKYVIEKLHFPVDGYNYDVKMLTSVDGGKNFYYCGYGKFFRTEEEAVAYKEEQELK